MPEHAEDKSSFAWKKLRTGRAWRRMREGKKRSKRVSECETRKGREDARRKEGEDGWGRDEKMRDGH